MITVFFKNKRWSHGWFYVSMLLIIVNDTLVYLDFSGYFRAIAIFISIFYIICTITLRKFIKLERIKASELVTFPVITSLFLVVYLMISVIDMIAPYVKNALGYFIAIFITQLTFVGACVYVYFVNKYKGSFLLFIAASCCLFVNAFLPVNEFYFYHVAFTVVINIAESLGLFFYTKFLIEASEKKCIHEENNYL
ncbi:hypothetical protein ACE939_02535 [Aquimarina sp. W85]|uniref:hypothetical protein n=1 Tax=Aquimarina rhodophyticola TaxID=3342246 RepID=UPI00366FAC8C